VIVNGDDLTNFMVIPRQKKSRSSVHRVEMFVDNTDITGWVKIRIKQSNLSLSCVCLVHCYW
jgi:hypothetical protein